MIGYASDEVAAERAARCGRVVTFGLDKPEADQYGIREEDGEKYLACGEVLRSLMERGLVRVAGRAELPGSPLLYGTTPHFLEVFGLRNLRDLPKNP